MKSSENQHNYIDSLIERGQFVDAIRTIRSSDTKGATVIPLAECANTYRFMLSYFEQSQPGVADNSRPALYAKIKEGLHRANDMLEVSVMEASDNGSFYTQRRNRSVRHDSDIKTALAAIAPVLIQCDLTIDSGTYDTSLQKKSESLADTLFINIWTTIHLSKTEQELLFEFLTDNSSQSAIPVQSLVLSALLLGCLKYYDYRKLELLIRTLVNVNILTLSARALVGIMLIIYKYGNRVNNLEKISSLTSMLAEDETLSAIRKFIYAMLRTIDTERVNRHVKSEIFPDLMRLKPDIEKQMKDMSDKIRNLDIEENPDWENLLNKSGITDKLKELTEMQMDGADIFMSAFANMKGFSFFRNMSNWFLPFDARQSDVKQACGALPETLLTMLSGGNYFCSSDKYSMALALAKMPPEQLRMMGGQMTEQLRSMQEEAVSSLKALQPDLDSEIRLYLKDLYRFFKLKNEDIPDPFKGVFEIPHTAPFTALLTDRELLRGMAEFYFKYGYQQQAVDLFVSLSDISETQDEAVLQKLGYCYQLIGNNDKALEVYQHAELLNPDSVWLLKRIATLLRDMKRYDEAAQYCTRALEHQPDNLSLEMLLGNILMLGNRPSEALKSFYKIKYLKPESNKTDRPIAWCEFLLGEYDKSISRYDSMPNMDASDMLNCGHAHLAKGDISGAKRIYRSCVSALKRNGSEFRRLMAKDTGYLTKAGIDPLTIALIEDLCTSTDEDLAVM